MAATSAPAALELFLELAALSTPSGAERAAADRCAAYLRALGVEVAEDDAAGRIDGDAGNLYARIPPTTGGTPVFFCAHLDTVPPTDAIEPVVADGVVTNARHTILGADNKASVAGMLDGVRRVLADGVPHAGMELVLTAQEEPGLRGAKAFDASRLHARTGFVYDHAGPLGGIVMAAAGQNTIRLRFVGRAAHAGIAPEQGRNAIAAAAHALAAMRFGKLDDETTANVGVIAGGEARNVVPPSCDVELEVRSRNPERLASETARVLEAAAAGATVVGCSCESAVEPAYVAYRYSRSHRVVRIARAALEACGHAVREELSNGGADTHVFRAAGIECVTLTSGMEAIHTPDEHIAVADVEGMSDLTVAIVRAAAAA
jgi:tripeptide aminopeptidase